MEMATEPAVTYVTKADRIKRLLCKHAGPWSEWADVHDRRFYFNSETRVSTWTAPENYLTSVMVTFLLRRDGKERAKHLRIAKERAQHVRHSWYGAALKVCSYLPLHLKRILLTILTCLPHILTFKNAQGRSRPLRRRPRRKYHPALALGRERGGGTPRWKARAEADQRAGARQGARQGARRGAFGEEYDASSTKSEATAPSNGTSRGAHSACEQLDRASRCDIERAPQRPRRRGRSVPDSQSDQV